MLPEALSDESQVRYVDCGYCVEDHRPVDPGIVEEIEFDFHGVIVVRVGWITSLVNRLKFKHRKQKVQ